MWPRGLSVLQEEPQHRTEVSGLQTGDHWQGHHPGENIREVLQDEDRQRCRHHRGPGGGGGGAGATGAEKYNSELQCDGGSYPGDDLHSEEK